MKNFKRFFAGLMVVTMMAMCACSSCAYAEETTAAKEIAATETAEQATAVETAEAAAGAETEEAVLEDFVWPEDMRITFAVGDDVFKFYVSPSYDGVVVCSRLDIEGLPVWDNYPMQEDINKIGELSKILQKVVDELKAEME